MIEASRFVQSSRTLTYEAGSDWFERWRAEIDPTMKRLRLFRTRFGKWTKIVVDCSLDDCVAVGTVEYNTEGHIGYGTYFKLRSGSWHAIPLESHSFEDALRVVKQVSAATNIPRLDVKYS